jgi:hypothetical protein
MSKTLRDEFAIAALASCDGGVSQTFEEAAYNSYKMADAMIEERYHWEEGKPSPKSPEQRGW